MGDEIDTSHPRLINLNQDPLFSETVTYYIQEGVTMLGSDPQACDIHLSGVDIRPHHCCITNVGGHVTIYPFAEDCDTYVDGHLISTPERSLAKRPGLPETAIQPTKLSHRGRLILGRHHFFRFEQGSRAVGDGAQGGLEHGQAAGVGEEVAIDWDYAHRELLEGQARAAQATPPPPTPPRRFAPLTMRPGSSGGALEGSGEGPGIFSSQHLPPQRQEEEEQEQAGGRLGWPRGLRRGPSPALSEGSWRASEAASRTGAARRTKLRTTRAAGETSDDDAAWGRHAGL